MSRPAMMVVAISGNKGEAPTWPRRNADAGYGRELRCLSESGKQIVDDDLCIGASERRDLVPGCMVGDALVASPAAGAVGAERLPDADRGRAAGRAGRPRRRPSRSAEPSLH